MSKHLICAIVIYLYLHLLSTISDVVELFGRTHKFHGKEDAPWADKSSQQTYINSMAGIEMYVLGDTIKNKRCYFNKLET